VFEAPLAFDSSQECTKMLTEVIRTGISNVMSMSKKAVTKSIKQG